MINNGSKTKEKWRTDKDYEKSKRDIKYKIKINIKGLKNWRQKCLKGRVRGRGVVKMKSVSVIQKSTIHVI